MKNQGFTLIELLAIIVILSIIALIAIPMISRIIDKTENSAAKRGAELYVDAINQSITRENLSSKFRPKECIIQEDGNLICDGNKSLKIETTGSRPRSGKVKIENRRVVSFDKMILDLYELGMKENENVEIIRTLIDEFDYNNMEYLTDNSNASIPELLDSLTPVVFGNDRWRVADIKKSWYNYGNHQWANAVVLKSGVTKKVGSIVDIDKDVQGMFVWIPRYEYKIDGTYGRAPGAKSIMDNVENDKSYPWSLTDGIYKSTTQNRHGSTTTIKFKFTLTKKETLSFDWSVSSESVGCDYIYYTIIKDGTALSDTGESTKIGGNTTGSSDSTMVYTNVAKTLEPGTYELTFTYRKDGSVNTGTDAGYVKNIAIGGASAELPGEIDINFINKDTTKASEGYILHPAFNFGGKELKGIWVGKFETSTDRNNACYTDSNDTNCNNTNQIPYVLPNVSSLRYQDVSKQFATAQKFDEYIKNGDAHMMKNVDWAAVAYLSQSKYGKYGNSNYTGINKQVMVNNCENFITGIGADSQDAEVSTSTCKTNTYTTLKGQAASTTGNVTGIYDMSGGAWEYVMGNYNGTIKNAGFSAMPEAKYYDKYTTTDMLTACNGGVCYGHALSETNWWYGDFSGFLDATYPWMRRGGGHNDKSTAGLFYHASYDEDGGKWKFYNSFRITITE